MIERQMTSKSCGVAVLSRLLALFGQKVSQWDITQKYPLGRNGWTIDQLSEAAINWGVKLTAERKVYKGSVDLNTPVIILANNHYILLESCKKGIYRLYDPIVGQIRVKSLSDYLSVDDSFIYIAAIRDKSLSGNGNGNKPVSVWTHFWPLYKNYKSLLLKILLLMLITGAMQFVLPFISRSIIDTGIGTNSWSFVKILLVANICLVGGIIIGTFLQTYISTFIANCVKNHMLDNYIIRLLSLPMTVIS